MGNPSYDARSTATAAEPTASDQAGPDRSELDRAAGDGPTTHSKSAPETPLAAPEGALNVLVNLQSAEIQRLSRANEQLFGRIETFLQIQEREQVLRQQLQNQLDRLTERLGLPTPAVNQVAEPDRGSAERHTGDKVKEEIKPVLVAILDVLERSFQQPETGPEAASVPMPEARQNPLPPEPYRTLPDILTRPVEDLVSGPPPGAERAKLHDQPRPGDQKAAHNAAKAESRPAEPAPALPSLFAWMAIFS